MANPSNKGMGQGHQGHTGGNQGHGSTSGTGTLEQAKDVASNLAGQARDVLGQAGQAVSGAASAVGQRVEDLTTSAARGAQSLASTVRDQGPREGYLGSATQSVASGIEQAGKYLEDKHLTGMADDFGSLIKAHPIPAVLIGLGVGFLLGRALRD